jgi:diaminopimelate decarboxylase
MNLPPQFSYRDGQLFIEDVSLASVGERFGTPVYIYSKAALVNAYAAYADALRPQLASDMAMICYAVKANSNLAILSVFAKGGSGFDIVSGGELERVLAAGGDPQRVIFSGVGKTRDEMRYALEVGIGCFNIESLSEGHQLAAVANETGKSAPVSLRINPDVDARTHPYIATGLKESKFGIAYSDALDAYRAIAAMPSLRIIGVDCHIGSQLLDDEPLMDALEKLLDLVDRLAEENIAIEHVDLGGGIGIRYGNEDTNASIDVASYIGRVVERIDNWQGSRNGRPPVKLLFEPGRSLVGNAGALLMRTLVLKPGAAKNFAIVDAAMNDLLRPALYDAWHEFAPVDRTSAQLPKVWDIVGPVCESGDWLARERSIALSEGDLLACLSTGAYGIAMASNYNSRPRAAEVLIDGSTMHLIRDRESIASLFAGEHLVE